MFDSRQFLQFMVDRKLGFNSYRNLSFDTERDLLFDSDRNLSFDHDRDLLFGLHGPVFRGRACTKCKMLVHPLEESCRSCGTRVASVMQPAKAKARTHTRTRRPARKKAPPAATKEMMVCPNCALKIPGDSIYCPRCRVKIDEWRQYLRDLRQWEEQVQRAAAPQVPRQPPQRYYDDRWHDINVRRRR
jgi:RNA polymerase subunit RPABC4/transcription elongation factor Spt4